MKYQEVRLDEACDIIMGQAPSGEAYNDVGKGWPLVAGAGDFGDIHPRPKKYTTEAAKLSRDGDIILGVRASIGDKVWSDSEYCLGRGVAGLRPKLNLDRTYLWHWLDHIRPEIARKAKGATFKQVTREDIAELPFALLPLDEQRRIAAILDKADAIRKKRRDALMLADEFLRSVFLDMFGDLFSAPDDSRWKKLSVCTDFIDYRGKTPEKSDSGVRLITAKNVRDGVINPEPAEFISDETYSWWMSRGYPRSGDVLFTTEAPLGNVSVLNTQEPVAIGQRLIAIRPREMLRGDYLSWALRQNIVQRDIFSRATGSTVKGIRSAELVQVKVPVPDKNDQLKFEKIVALVGHQKTAMNVAAGQSNLLFQSLQHRAFQGQL